MNLSMTTGPPVGFSILYLLYGAGGLMSVSSWVGRSFWIHRGSHPDVRSAACDCTPPPPFAPSSPPTFTGGEAMRYLKGVRLCDPVHDCMTPW
ncbi:hypothetical protein OF83DRAFT_1119079 [Amylostereum chailletii]|nr:hypothetical protein OF83DRAFT_1119079 [Amylostereum chailletii]